MISVLRRQLWPNQAAHAARATLAALVSVVTLVAAAGCGGGLRPTLVAEPIPTEEPALELSLPPAPQTVVPLAPAPVDLTLESSVDDALLSWALDRGVPYTDNCDIVTPEPGQLCDSPTARETVRLLGPSPAETWYVVTVASLSSFDTGTGFRVSAVDIAGR